MRPRNLRADPNAADATRAGERDSVVARRDGTGRRALHQMPDVARGLVRDAISA